MKLPRVRSSVRGMMILVLVFGAGVGWTVRNATIQRNAVAALQQGGGRVTYNWEWKDGNPIPSTLYSTWPKWLVDAMGPDYFGHPVAVFLNRTAKVDDSLMNAIAQFGRLQHLSLNGCSSVTDEGVARLRGLMELTYLDLSFTGATGASLKNLKEMTRLKHLELPGGPYREDDFVHLERLKALEWLQCGGVVPSITDECFLHLKGLVNLNLLSIHSPRITSAGLVALHDMVSLKTLNLHSTGISNLAPIQHLTGLTGLYISNTRLDDVGLSPVQDLKAITHLDLNDTRTSDAGMAHIAGLTKLQNLWLNGTAISDKAIPHLAQMDGLDLLFLEKTRVSDVSLPSLMRLKKCHQIAIGGTAITDAGIAAATGSMPPKIRFVRMR